MTDLGTFLWIGDGGRPTYTVVEHVLRLRWADPPDQTGLAAGVLKWRISTLERKPSTVWPLASTWPRQGHVSADLLTWEPHAYPPYDTVFVDNFLCWGHATQSYDIAADTWESPTLQGKTRAQKLDVWASCLAALEACYLLTSGTADADDVEDGDVIPDMTPWGYRLLASQSYERRVHTGWYIWQRA